MNTNTFYCYECKEYTRHVKISYGEAEAIRANNHSEGKIKDGLSKLFGHSADLTGIGRFYNALGYAPWKCTKCGWAARREPDGHIIDDYGKSF